MLFIFQIAYAGAIFNVANTLLILGINMAGNESLDEMLVRELQ